MQELEEYGNLYHDKKRKSNHLIVGILRYPEFTSKFKVLKGTSQFKRFNGILAGVFESIIFSELYWKIDVIKSIERLIL